MTATNGLGTYGDGAGVVTPSAHKAAQLGLVTKTGAGTNAIRAGLFFDGVSNIVTGTANMSYNVAAFTAVSSRGASSGAVLFANDGTVNVVTTAAPGTNSRIDSVYVWQREFALDGGSTAPVVGVVQGTAAASPTAPSLAAFPGAIELARITVPAGVTATNSGTTITQTAPFTATAGGLIPARNFAGLPATATNGDRARLIDTGITYERVGGAWVAQYEQIDAPITPNAGYTITGQTLRREGRVVTIFFQATKSTNWGISENIGTLNPAAIRPVTRNAVGAAFNNTTVAALTAQITTAGGVFFLGSGSVVGTTTFIGQVSYILP